MNRIPPITLVYDRECELCGKTRQILAKWDRRRRIRYLAFQDRAFQELFPDLDRSDPEGVWPYDEPPRSMLFIDGHGNLHQGVAAFRSLLPYLSGGWILLLLFRLPGVPWVAVRFYEWLARNRYRIFGRSS